MNSIYLNPKRASFEEILTNNLVQCKLCPRECIIKKDKLGFCKVRGNIDGRLKTFIYGKGIHLTEESIETEAVFHYSPGSRILSIGNIGCNLNCDYCQNWKTSQINYIDENEIHEFTPQDIINKALKHNIKILSWTYNDPVIWHEFVRDSASLAKKAGLINLFKSALYINPDPLKELIPLIDIFSISLKSVNNAYYKKITKGSLQPVLKAIETIAHSGKHLELSMLMITDISDSSDYASELSDYVVKNIGTDIPLHFVRFHPDYKMTDTTRTPVEKLEEARLIAKEKGIKHVYIGNTFDTDHSQTSCTKCGYTLVKRYGLNAEILGLEKNGNCTSCGEHGDIKYPLNGFNNLTALNSIKNSSLSSKIFTWHGDIGSLHVQLNNISDENIEVYYRYISTFKTTQWITLNLSPKERYRLILTKQSTNDKGFEFLYSKSMEVDFLEVFDRAHYPTIDDTRQ